MENEIEDKISQKPYETKNSLKLKIKLKVKEFEAKSNSNIHKRQKSPFIKRNTKNYDKHSSVEYNSKKLNKEYENDNINDSEKKGNKRPNTPKKEKRSKPKKNKKEIFDIKEELKDILVNKNHNLKICSSKNISNTNNNNEENIQTSESNDSSKNIIKLTSEEINERLDKLINKLLLAKEYKPNTEIDLKEDEVK